MITGNYKVKNYLPSVYDGILETDELMKVEQELFDDVKDKTDNLQNNITIMTSDKDRIAEYEKLLGLKFNSQYNIDIRRQKVLNKLLTKPPFTMNWLIDRLDNLIGQGLYEIEYNPSEYEIIVYVENIDNEWSKDVTDMLKQVIPANMGYELKEMPSIVYFTSDGLNANYVLKDLKIYNIENGVNYSITIHNDKYEAYFLDTAEDVTKWEIVDGDDYNFELSTAILSDDKKTITFTFKMKNTDDTIINYINNENGILKIKMNDEIIFNKNKTEMYEGEIDYINYLKCEFYGYIIKPNEINGNSEISENIGLSYNNDNDFKEFIEDEIRPCLLKYDGSVDCYLSLDDINYDINGNDISDTTCNYMVEFPKIYTSCAKSSEGIIVKMSKAKLDDNYNCDAFIRGGIEKDYLYIGMFPTSLEKPDGNPFNQQQILAGTHENYIIDREARQVSKSCINVNRYICTNYKTVNPFILACIAGDLYPYPDIYINININMVNLIKLLYLLKFKDFDSENYIKEEELSVSAFSSPIVQTRDGQGYYKMYNTSTGTSSNYLSSRLFWLCGFTGFKNRYFGNLYTGRFIKNSISHHSVYQNYHYDIIDNISYKTLVRNYIQERLPNLQAQNEVQERIIKDAIDNYNHVDYVFSVSSANLYTNDFIIRPIGNTLDGVEITKDYKTYSTTHSKIIVFNTSTSNWLNDKHILYRKRIDKADAPATPEIINYYYDVNGGFAERSVTWQEWVQSSQSYITRTENIPQYVNIFDENTAFENIPFDFSLLRSDYTQIFLRLAHL